MPRRIPFFLMTVLAVVTPVAGARAAGTAPTIIGGDRLASTGVVVDPMPGAPPLPSGISAASWVVADLDTGDILAARAPHVKHLPASTQKILTALTLIPRLSPTQQVTVTNADVDVDGSKVGLMPGVRYTVAQLFTAMLVVSGNDAADTLAAAAGGTEKTLALMNAEAHHLQAFDTVARTPSGLDAPGQSTSAYDLALIARAAMQLPDFRGYVATVKSHMPAGKGKTFEIYTHNRLLTGYRGTIGVKNGYTIAAQATYVGAATRNGHTLLVTLMKGQPAFWHDAEPLLDWGFKAEGSVTPVGQLVDPLPDHPEVGPPPQAKLHAAKTVAVSGDAGVSPITIGLAGFSAATVVVVTTRRRRRSRRMSLPPL